VDPDLGKKVLISSIRERQLISGEKKTRRKDVDRVVMPPSRSRERHGRACGKDIVIKGGGKTKPQEKGRPG